MATKKTSKRKVDVEYLRKIGARGGRKTAKRKGRAYFSRIAKLSHPKNNPDAKRKKYVGGRPHNEDELINGTLAD